MARLKILILKVMIMKNMFNTDVEETANMDKLVNKDEAKKQLKIMDVAFKTLYDACSYDIDAGGVMKYNDITSNAADFDVAMDKLKDLLGIGRYYYDVVLKEDELDSCLCLNDVGFLFEHLRGGGGIPIEFQGQNSTAMGFISFYAAEKLSYGYDAIGEFIEEILSDMEKETPDGVYEYKTGDETFHILIARY